MAQLDFHVNFPGIVSETLAVASNGTLSFVPMSPSDSVSFNKLNFYMSAGSNATFTLSIGLYSLTGSTLSITNSMSRSITLSNFRGYVSLSATSVAQNITPGTWWLGLLVSTGGNSSVAFVGQSFVNPGNAFPGGFIGGRMTDSTNALPASYATSNLDVTGTDAMSVPTIILTA